MSKQRKSTIWLAKLSHWSQYDRIPRVSAAEVSLCAAYGGHLKIIVARARSGLDPTLSGGSRAAGGAPELVPTRVPSQPQFDFAA